MATTDLKILVAKIPLYMDHNLKVLANKTGRSKSYYVRKAIERFFIDREEYLNNRKTPKNRITNS